MMLGIRPAVSADVPRLIELNALVHAWHVARHPEAYRPAAADQVAAWLRGCLADARTRCLAAEAEDGCIVGYAVARIAARPENAFMRARTTLYIDHICVDPGHRRRGVGRSLLLACEAAAAAAGCTAMEMDTRSGNAEALAAFQAVGYAPVQVRLAKELVRGAKT